jgi:hypothetical protein
MASALLFAIGFMIFNMHKNNIVVVCIVLIIGFASFLALGITALNRGGCTITYDASNNTLYRKGYIYGFKSQLAVAEITEIIVVQLPKEPKSYVLVDTTHTMYWGFDKKSFFKIEKTKKNQEFIEQFWNKPIKEYKKYEDLLCSVNTSNVNIR